MPCWATEPIASRRSSAPLLKLTGPGEATATTSTLVANRLSSGTRASSRLAVQIGPVSAAATRPGSVRGSMFERRASTTSKPWRTIRACASSRS